MIPEWVNIVAPVAAALSGVVVAGGVNYWFANRRERRQMRLETEAAAVMLLAEIERINYRLGMAIQEQNPESPKRDFNKAFYHSLQPRIGLMFRPQTIEALVTFYQSVELVETCADSYNMVSDENWPEFGKRWKDEVQMAYLKYRPQVLGALNEERSGTSGSGTEVGPKGES